MTELNTNDIFAGRYLLIEKIGIGGFSEVWKAQDQMAEEKVVAIKIYSPERGMDETGLKQFRREYSLVLDISHSSLLTARHFDIWLGSPYLVLPFCSKGSLYSKISDEGVQSEQEIISMLSQICTGLAYLHENDILHQDIKPENILINEKGNYQLTDFGISGRLRSTLRKTAATQKAMTMAYAAPELFSAQPFSTPKSDIFSLGVLIWELCTGDVPWMGAGGVVLRADSELPVLPKSYSRSLNNLMQSCLQFNPEKRPTSKEMVATIVALKDNSKTNKPKEDSEKVKQAAEQKQKTESRKTVVLENKKNEVNIKIDNIPKEIEKSSLNMDKIAIIIFVVVIILITIIIIISIETNSSSTDDSSSVIEIPAVEATPALDLSIGKSIYDSKCKVCHQENGLGLYPIYPPLDASDYLLSDIPRAFKQIQNASEVPIIVNGIEYKPYGMRNSYSYMNQDEIINVMNYILNSWSNNYGQITLDDVTSPN